MKIPCALAVAVLALATSAQAEWIEAKFKGEVNSNDFKNGFFGDVDEGDKAKMKLYFNTADFTDNDSGNKRGYMIDLVESSLKLGSLNVDLAAPIPESDAPYFVLKNDKNSGKDQLYLSSEVGSANSVLFGDAESDAAFTIKFKSKFKDGKAIKSVDIMKALGKHKSKDMKKTSWSVSLDQGGNDKVDVSFSKVKFKVTNVPGPAALLGIAPLMLLSRRRRG
jgi:hypothetical protein